MYIPEDIKGSHPKKEIRFLNKNIINDEKNTIKKKKSNRHTNPLDPTYIMKYNEK